MRNGVKGGQLLFQPHWCSTTVSGPYVRNEKLYAAVVVNGSPSSRLMSFFEPLKRFSRRLRSATTRLFGGPKPEEAAGLKKGKRKKGAGENTNEDSPKGTYTNRHDVAWVKGEVGAQMPVEILVWRSVSVRFLRSLIHPWLGGRLWLRLLFWL